MKTHNPGEQVLITGASGFIGSHLAAHLSRQGDQVRCLVRRTSSLRYLRGLNVQLVHGDLTSKDDLTAALAGVDVVYAVAGTSRAGRPADYYRGNTQATARLVQASLAAQQRGMCRLRRFVFVSSLAAGGPSPDGGARVEHNEDRPVSAYGRSKLLAEQVVRQAGTALPAAIVRPPIVYGPRDTDFFLILRSAARGWVAQVVPSDTGSYSLIHVDDLVRGLVLAADHPQAVGQTYYLAGEPACTWPELLATLSQAFNRPVRTLRVPRWLACWAGGAAELAASLTRRPFILNRDKVRETSHSGWVCAAAKAARELGYAATVPLAVGLGETIQWYRRHGWL